ncbi:hypothetical protein EC973_006934 [Apophysomyces ossiformis]|uniref:Uncharacterized protein n=1 Tax=Apophysomyces ossiformis TaxID=679940 RepID=A0A8H7BE74_9FUNG|nr:hypothetical protein EC973_006934 [Apophysomyces ossiformis]
MSDQIAHLEALITQLSEHVTTFKAVLQENTKLRQYIVELETCLAIVNPSFTATSAPAKVVARPLKNSISTRYKATAARSFQPITGPQGFTYIYLHCSQKMDRLEIYKQLQKLKIDTSCLLDITFPARSIVSLLFHLQYTPKVVKLLDTVKVKTLKDFDSLNPTYIGDSNLTNNLSEIELANVIDLR